MATWLLEHASNDQVSKPCVCACLCAAIFCGSSLLNKLVKASMTSTTHAGYTNIRCVLVLVVQLHQHYPACKSITLYALYVVLSSKDHILIL